MFRTILSIGLLQACGIVVTVLRTKVLAVLLGPAGFGIVATIDQLVASLAQLSNLSVPFTALKFLSNRHSIGEAEFQKAYLAFLRLMLGLAVIATAASVAIVLLILERLGSQLAAYRTTVIVAVLGLPALLLMMFFVNALAARQESMRSVSLTVLYNLVLLVFGGLGCWLGGIHGIYVGSVPAATVLIALTWLALRPRSVQAAERQGSGAIWAALKSHEGIVQTAAYTYIAVASIAGTMLLARYLSITQLSAEAAGLFQACFAIAMSIGAVLGPVNSLYLSPHLNRAISSSDKTATVARFVPRLVFLFSLAALPVLLFPEFVLQLLFSGRFVSAASVLVWFVAWQYVSQVVTIYHHLLIGLDDMRGFCLALVAGNAVTVAGSYAWLGAFGLAGLGGAFVAGVIVSMILTLSRLRRRHSVTLPRGCVLPLIAAPAGLVVLSMLPLGSETEALGVISRMSVAAGFVAVLGFALPRELRLEVWNGVKTLLARSRKPPT